MTIHPSQTKADKPIAEEEFLFESHVALRREARAQLVATANEVLASSIDLQYQVKQAHWNIKGPQFFSRHQLFDHIAAHVVEAVDAIAERAATLGGYAMGTVRMAAKTSQLPELDVPSVDGRTLIKALIANLGRWTKQLRGALDEAEQLSDPVTVDLYTETLRTAELDLWFLESHVNSSTLPRRKDKSMLDSKSELVDRVKARKKAIEAHLHEMRANAKSEIREDVNKLEHGLEELKEMIGESWDKITDKTAEKLNQWLGKHQVPKGDSN